MARRGVPWGTMQKTCDAPKIAAAGPGGDATSRATAARERGEGAGVSRTPLWLLGGAAAVLAFTVFLLTLASMHRNERAMSRLLGEKGSALIDAYEGVLRSGMRSEAGVRLQLLLEAAAENPDIVFAAVTMPDGTIVAHSNPDRLGEMLQAGGGEADAAFMRGLAPAPLTRWRDMELEGRRVFAVYRQFAPGRRRPPGLPQPVIFLGLDPAPFAITRRQNRDFVIMLAAGTLLAGLTCLLALYYAGRARESRLRQRRAEGKVRRLEAEVRRREKLAAVGTLAAGVAHEIRNPLSSIKGYATYFGQRFPEGSEDREAAAVMVREVDRLNRVITDLIGLSRPSDVRPRPVDLRAVAAHAARLISLDAERRGVRVACRASPRAPLALADPERLGQAVLNLCLNALDAMPRGGRLTLAVSGRAGRACLLVRDTGEGIPPERLSRIFDPYFTTKGQGTGLGLATAHKILEAHNGEIAVASRPAGAGRRGGTTFRLWLPAAEGQSAAGADGHEEET